MVYLRDIVRSVLVVFLMGYFISAFAQTDDGIPLGSDIGELPPPVGEAIAPNSVTTTFASNNRFGGNTFDLQKLGTIPLTITGFDVNIDDRPGDIHTVSIYYRHGTSVGNENNAAAWTLLGSDTNVASAGRNAPSHVDVGGLVLDQPGHVVGIYVDLVTYENAEGAGLAYTNGGPQVYSNADLQLTTNTGQRSPAFSGSFSDRRWNGTVYYQINEASPVPTMSIWGLGILAGLLGLVGYRMRRRLLH